MKTLLSVFLGILALSAVSFGQIVINSTDIPAIGSSTTLGLPSTPVTFDIGSAGENQSWTFGLYPIEFVNTCEVIDPASAPHAASFPTATHCTHIFSPDQFGAYRYEQVTGTERLGLGAGYEEEIYPQVQPSIELPFPCTYQTGWTCLRRREYDMEGMIFVEQDSSVLTVDGWGTVTTPYGTWPALRVFSQMWFTVTIEGEIVESWSALFYDWKNQQGENVCRVQSLDDSDPNFSTGWITLLGVPLSVDPARGPVTRRFELGQNYPNPFNPSTTLPIALASPAHVSVDVYDETGRLVSHEEYELPAGPNSLSVDGSPWATGVYFARVTAAGQSQTKKLMLLK